MSATDVAGAGPPQDSTGEGGGRQHGVSLFDAAELGRVRRYARLAAILQSVVVLALAFGLAWLAWPGNQSELAPARIAGSLAVGALAAALWLLRSELHLRSFALEISDIAVIFEYGRLRSWIPRSQVQIVDTERSILLRAFGLTRCLLHTGGGMVTISPIPVNAAVVIERAIQESRAAAQADDSDAG